VRRVAITGIGILSCLGHDLETVAEALQNGRSGVKLVPERKELGFNSALAAPVGDFPMPALGKGFERQLGRNGRMAVACGLMAIADAGIARQDLGGERAGVIVGNAGNMEEIFQLIQRKYTTKRKLTALAMARTMTSTVSANLSIFFKMRGQCMTIGTACASGAAAIGEAAQLIRLGKQDRMLAGGVQEGSWEFDILFDSLRVFSNREDSPQQASRPFDSDRDGLVPAGGCGLVVLEDYEQAVKRGARIRAELIGYGINADGYTMTTPSGEGAIRCMKLALADAGVAPDRIDYINAHATATPLGDAAEAQGIAAVFGEHPYVSSTKSMTGHELGAAGATEVIYTLLMMERSFIAPSINIGQIGDDCRGIRIVAGEAIDRELDVTLSNSSGFGGVNTSLILKKCTS